MRPPIASGTTSSLYPGDFDPSGSCAASKDAGWCYLTGSAAGGCAQRIVFSAGQPSVGSTVALVCPALQ